MGRRVVAALAAVGACLLGLIACSGSSGPGRSSPHPNPDGSTLPRPTGLTASVDPAGTYLTWQAGSGRGFTVEQATDAGFGTGVREYTVRGSTTRFTPVGLRKGTTYHFRVRAQNGSAHSAYSTAVTATPVTAEQRVRVLTYNILGAEFDGQQGGSEPVRPWDQRRVGVAALITRSEADAVGVQEAEAYVDAAHQVRQVDSLASALGDQYALADTNTGPSGADPLVGNYILYRSATLTPVGRGGFFQLDASGNIQRAAYQAFHYKSNGAGFLFITLHLGSLRGAEIDARRAVQTRSLVEQATAYAERVGIHAIVYSGDFNTYPGRPGFPDTAGDAMRSALVVDDVEVAPTLTNQQYDSKNNYLRTPPQGHGSMDRVFSTGGVGVLAWHEGLELADGRFAGTIPSDHNPVYVDLTVPY